MDKVSIRALLSQIDRSTKVQFTCISCLWRFGTSTCKGLIVKYVQIQICRRTKQPLLHSTRMSYTGEDWLQSDPCFCHNQGLSGWHNINSNSNHWSSFFVGYRKICQRNEICYKLTSLPKMGQSFALLWNAFKLSYTQSFAILCCLNSIRLALMLCTYRISWWIWFGWT